MSVSSYSSCVSSSSSSSSSLSTGSFSSSCASFSSRSTIVAPQAIVRSFGNPEYNYFWIENRSKTNPKKSYFYNYKSHAVVWNRPLPKDVPIPFYTSTWGTRKNQFFDDDEDLVVSEEENCQQKEKRLIIKQRNRRLLLEDVDAEVQVQSIKKTIKNKRMLDVLWKLYRLPGESVQDVKKRMIPTMENAAVKKEKEVVNLENDDNILNIPIKQEPLDDAVFSVQIEENEKIIKKAEDDSDYDEDNVSALIKQEYTMNYQDSELEEELRDETENIQDEYGSDFEDTESKNTSEEEENQSNLECNIEPEIIKPYDSDSNDENYEQSYPLADLLEIEINENVNKEYTLMNLYNDLALYSSSEEDVNWTFQTTLESINNSGLTRLALNPYHTQKLKQRTSKTKTKIKRLQKKKSATKSNKKIAKINMQKKPLTHVEPKADSNDDPIICNTYGTRTINFDHPPKLKIPEWQSCTRLSDSSNSEAEFECYKKKKEEAAKKVAPSKLKKKREGPLELRNWFPKRNRTKKRKRNSSNSDKSWCESNFSDYSEIDESDITLVKIKKERKSSFDDENANVADVEDEDEGYSGPSGKVSVPSIKPEKMPLTRVPDLSLVKVERRSSDDVDYGNYPVKQPLGNNFVENFYHKTFKTDSKDNFDQNMRAKAVENPNKSTVDQLQENNFIQKLPQDITLDQQLENGFVAQSLGKAVVKAASSDSDSDTSSSSSSTCSRSSCSGCRSSSSSSDEEDAKGEIVKTGEIETVEMRNEDVEIEKVNSAKLTDVKMEFGTRKNEEMEIEDMKSGGVQCEETETENMVSGGIQNQETEIGGSKCEDLQNVEAKTE